MSSDTIFEKILKHEVPASVVFEDDYVMAFKDICPHAPVHVLVIPKKKARNFSEMGDWNSKDIGDFVARIAVVAKKLNLDKDGYRVVFNCGQNGGQTVDYIHAHILGGKPLNVSMA